LPQFYQPDCEGVSLIVNPTVTRRAHEEFILNVAYFRRRALSETTSQNELTIHSVATWVDSAIVTPPPAGATVCWLPSCRALAFAEVRSSQGRALICFKHYEKTRELARERRAVRAAR